MGSFEGYRDPKESRREAKRSLRRAHKVRMGKRAVRFYPDMDPAMAMRMADHIKMCSCWMCGNQRKHFGPTLQEVRQASKERYQGWESR